jgi:hypothetical protein
MTSCTWMPLLRSRSSSRLSARSPRARCARCIKHTQITLRAILRRPSIWTPSRTYRRRRTRWPSAPNSDGGAARTPGPRGRSCASRGSPRRMTSRRTAKTSWRSSRTASTAPAAGLVPPRVAAGETGGRAGRASSRTGRRGGGGRTTCGGAGRSVGRMLRAWRG